MAITATLPTNILDLEMRAADMIATNRVALAKLTVNPKKHYNIAPDYKPKTLLEKRQNRIHDIVQISKINSTVLYEDDAEFLSLSARLCERLDQSDLLPTSAGNDDKHYFNLQYYFEEIESALLDNGKLSAAQTIALGTLLGFSTKMLQDIADASGEPLPFTAEKAKALWCDMVAELHPLKKGMLNQPKFNIEKLPYGSEKKIPSNFRIIGQSHEENDLDDEASLLRNGRNALSAVKERVSKCTFTFKEPKDEDRYFGNAICQFGQQAHGKLWQMP